MTKAALITYFTMTFSALVDHNYGSIEAALNDACIDDQKDRQEIKDFFGQEFDKGLPSELTASATEIGLDYSICSDDDTISDFLEETYGREVLDFGWEYKEQTPGCPLYVHIYNIEWDNRLDIDDPEVKKLYKAYLKEWKADHKGPEFKGMEPADFEEWYDGEYLESFEEDEVDEKKTKKISYEEALAKLNSGDWDNERFNDAIMDGEVEMPKEDKKYLESFEEDEEENETKEEN